VSTPPAAQPRIVPPFADSHVNSLAMIMPPDHARAVAARRALNPRERWILGGVAAVLTSLIVVVVISLSSTGHVSGNGCVDVALPYSTGGAELYRCGSDARAMCAAAGKPTGYTGAAGRAVATECRKAGLPVD
jgi:type II secretory pathway component PulM